MQGEDGHPQVKERSFPPSPRKDRALVSPRSWTSSLPSGEGASFCCVSPSLWFAVPQTKPEQIHMTTLTVRPPSSDGGIACPLGSCDVLAPSVGWAGCERDGHGLYPPEWRSWREPAARILRDICWEEPTGGDGTYEGAGSASSVRGGREIRARATPWRRPGAGTSVSGDFGITSSHLFASP